MTIECLSDPDRRALERSKAIVAELRELLVSVNPAEYVEENLGLAFLLNRAQGAVYDLTAYTNVALDVIDDASFADRLGELTVGELQHLVMAMTALDLPERDFLVQMRAGIAEALRRAIEAAEAEEAEGERGE